MCWAIFHEPSVAASSTALNLCARISPASTTLPCTKKSIASASARSSLELRNVMLDCACCSTVVRDFTATGAKGPSPSTKRVVARSPPTLCARNLSIAASPFSRSAPGLLVARVWKGLPPFIRSGAPRKSAPERDREEVEYEEEDGELRRLRLLRPRRSRRSWLRPRRGPGERGRSARSPP